MNEADKTFVAITVTTSVTLAATAIGAAIGAGLGSIVPAIGTATGCGLGIGVGAAIGIYVGDKLATYATSNDAQKTKTQNPLPKASNNAAGLFGSVNKLANDIKKDLITDGTQIKP